LQLALTEDQELLAKTALDFASKRSPLKRVRDLRDSDDADGFSRALWKEMAELGWLGIPFPEEFGGAGLGLAELAVVLEALGRSLAPEPFLSCTLLAGSVLRAGGSDAQQKAWLPGMIAGERFVGVAYQEAKSRFDPARVAARAERAGDGFTLSGEKTQVLDGASSDAFIVSARTSGAESDPDGVTLFLLPRDADGLVVTRQRRLDGRGAALVTLSGVSVTEDAVVGAVGEGAVLLAGAIDRATAGLCAEMLGSMSEAFDRTLFYLKSRKQFGALIGSFQALQHRAAAMFIEIELCRSAVMAAARALDEAAADAVKLVSLAKARCSDTALLVANEAIQMHGGIGMTDEHEIGFFLKRARVAELTFGDAAWHRDRWAGLSGY
jgi:alkylation response protein AidB-like acyl-CoA dehydrogenase